MTQRFIRNPRIKVTFITLVNNDTFMSRETSQKTEELFFIVKFETRVLIVLNHSNSSGMSLLTIQGACDFKKNVDLVGK